MDDEVQKELVRIAKLALVCISSGKRDENVLYALRDIIRKAEGNDGESVQRLHQRPDDLHRDGV
jgi:hypothetical protein